MARRAARALSLVHMGELSAARQALESAPVAPGTMATLRALIDPEKRPPVPRDDLSRVVAEFQPAAQFELDSVEFLVCLRRASRGAAVGHSGMTSDHLFPVEVASEFLSQVAILLSVGQVPHTILEAIRLGFQKPDGVRGIVVGDIIRRLVARTIAKQNSEKVEAATAPFQYALKTKAGCERRSRLADPDRVGSRSDNHVYRRGRGVRSISRNAMLEGFLRRSDLPFVRMFYGSPSTYLWEDEMGVTQSIARRSPHAHVVRPRTAWSVGSHTSEVGCWRVRVRVLGRHLHGDGPCESGCCSGCTNPQRGHRAEWHGGPDPSC